jgi:hypothetical protein
MAKGKVESTKKGNWGDFGGDGHMYKFDGTGTQTPGQSSQEGSGPRRGGVAAKGGNNQAFYSSGTTNKDFAGQQEAGTSGRTKTGSNNKFAEGGKTHMWGNRGSQKAVPGQSGCNG